ncbi:hypothetical protein GCM10008933_20720 [Paenibacillus motobuensis]|uniref:Uncharacterized protein n=1 Tax=Paenibacillus motobuensis TaxID=295324 RepID=A0ABP3I521_9BACL
MATALIGKSNRNEDKIDNAIIGVIILADLSTPTPKVLSILANFGSWYFFLPNNQIIGGFSHNLLKDRST